MAIIKKEQSIELPKGVSAKIDGRTLTITGPKGSVTREFNEPLIELKAEGNNVIISKTAISRKEKRYSNSVNAHVKGMVKGVQNGYVYKLKVCFSHFPINVAVAGTELSVKNFLGEKKPRVMKVSPGVKITVSGQDITCEGIDKELVSQAAANIERLTMVKNRDRRIFQDGIYITEKDGRSMLE